MRILRASDKQQPPPQRLALLPSLRFSLLLLLIALSNHVVCGWFPRNVNEVPQKPKTRDHHGSSATSTAAAVSPNRSCHRHQRQHESSVGSNNKRRLGRLPRGGDCTSTIEEEEGEDDESIHDIVVCTAVHTTSILATDMSSFF